MRGQRAPADWGPLYHWQSGPAARSPGMPGHRRRSSHGGGRAGGEGGRALREDRDQKDDGQGGGLQRQLAAVDDESGLMLLQQHSAGQLGSLQPDAAHGHSLVHTCAIAGHLRCLEHLLSAVALPADAKDRDDKSPLHHAAYHNHPDCVDTLLRYGADADAKAENRKFKSVMCRHHQQNACPFGDRCHFAYARQLPRVQPPSCPRAAAAYSCIVRPAERSTPLVSIAQAWSERAARRAGRGEASRNHAVRVSDQRPDPGRQNLAGCAAVGCAPAFHCRV